MLLFTHVRFLFNNLLYSFLSKSSHMVIELLLIYSLLLEETTFSMPD